MKKNGQHASTSTATNTSAPVTHPSRASAVVISGMARVRAIQRGGGPVKIPAVLSSQPRREITLGAMIDAYNLDLEIAQVRLGLQYRSGPRRGQQLAAHRVQAKREEATQPG